MKNIFIAGAVRTAIGKFGGSLGSLSITEVVSVVVREAMKCAGTEANDVEKVKKLKVKMQNYGIPFRWTVDEDKGK
jgi:acetyl-CoA acetyltransferase